MHALGPCEILGQHRTMKTNQPELVVKICEQAGEVAVSAENLWMFRDDIQIKMRQQVVRTISAARTDNGSYLGQAKHLVKLVDTTLYSSRKIEFAFEDALGKDGSKPKLLERQNTCFELLAIHRASRSHDANGVPFLENRRTN